MTQRGERAPGAREDATLSLDIEEERLAQDEQRKDEELEAAAAHLSAAGVADEIASGEAGTVEPGPSRTRPGIRGPRRAARPDTSATATDATSAPAPETLPYVDDPVSRVWVGLIAAGFVLVFLYALLGGQGGFLTTTPSPSPEPVESPSASVSGSPSRSPSPSGSPSGARGSPAATSPGGAGASGSAGASPSSGRSPARNPSASPSPSGFPGSS